MPDQLANGQFARKELREETGAKSAKKRGPGRPFKRGNPGKAKGTLNKTTRAVKEFLAELCNKVSVQEAVEARIQKGDAVAFFRALEHVVGKPTETINGEISHTVKVYRWKS